MASSPLTSSPHPQYGSSDVDQTPNQLTFDPKHLGKIAGLFSVLTVIGVVGVILAKNFMQSDTALEKGVVYGTGAVTLLSFTITFVALRQLCKCDERRYEPTIMI